MSMLADYETLEAPEKASASVDADTSSAERTLSAREEQRRQIILSVLDEIRPGLQRDGGDCQLVAVEGKDVLVRLTGACIMCHLASMTLEGIQSRIVEQLGEFIRLVPVRGGVRA